MRSLPIAPLLPRPPKLPPNLEAGKPAEITAAALLSALAFFGVLVVLPRQALAQSDSDETVPVAFEADKVRFDPKLRGLGASGHVRVDQSPFHLTSDELKLRRVGIGVELEGEGKLAFCDCPQAALAVRFSGATVAPPHDVILHDPVLEVLGVPLAWAPAVWLRSPAQFGLLPPDIAWRGEDGFFAGGGLHIPWSKGDAERGIDLRGGGYVKGGVAVEMAARTATTSTRLRWDRFHGDDGLAIAAFGSTAIVARTGGMDSVAWDVSALRGNRAVQAATDVGAAAQPFDRAQGEAQWRWGGWTFASGVRAAARRGGDWLDFGVGGPTLTARLSDAIAGAGAYDVTFEGGQLAGAGLGATSFARSDAGALLATRMGPFGTSLVARALGGVANDVAHFGMDGAAQARMAISLPLARSYPSPDATDPWVHTTEPHLEVAAGASRDSGVLMPVGRLTPIPDGWAWVVGGGWANVVGRWGARTTAELDETLGVVGDDRHAVPALRARGSVDAPWLGLGAELARVVGSLQAGGALLANLRLGPASGLHVATHVAQRDGIDPILARALVDPSLEPPTGFLAARGWTGGARAALPLGSRVTAQGGADVDMGARELVAALGSLELHDPCRCVILRATAAHRIGRGGLDVWVSVDLPPTAR